MVHRVHPTQPDTPHPAQHRAVMRALLPENSPITIITTRSAPPCRVMPLPHMTVKTRIRPINHGPDMPMPDRIPVQIIKTARHIQLITHLVFPEPPLPDTPLASP